MEPSNLFALLAMCLAAAATVLGTIMPARAQGQAVNTALEAIARQPDASDRISRTLFIGLAMIESLAIYALVIALILLFANPFQSLFTHQP
jgi:F-type H+-transporting ATPase subunit c